MIPLNVKSGRDVRLPLTSQFLWLPCTIVKADGGGYRYLWLACPASVSLSSKCTLIFPEGVHLYPVFSPWSLVRVTPSPTPGVACDPGLGQSVHFISLDIEWLRVGLVAQLGPGSQAQGLCLKWGLGALKELVSSGGQFATVREEAVENEDKHRGEQS